MKQDIVIITAATLGALSVIFGAFGAHALKKFVPDHLLKNFETGVKYQMYHAIVLLTIGFHFELVPTPIYWLFTLGTVLFSFSIYGLVLSSAKDQKIKLLGPVTPIGGTLLVIGWVMLILEFL